MAPTPISARSRASTQASQAACACRAVRAPCEGLILDRRPYRPRVDVLLPTLAEAHALPTRLDARAKNLRSAWLLHQAEVPRERRNRVNSQVVAVKGPGMRRPSRPGISAQVRQRRSRASPKECPLGLPSTEIPANRLLLRASRRASKGSVDAPTVPSAAAEGPLRQDRSQARPLGWHRLEAKGKLGLVEAQSIACWGSSAGKVLLIGCFEGFKRGFKRARMARRWLALTRCRMRDAADRDPRRPPWDDVGIVTRHRVTSTHGRRP